MGSRCWLFSFFIVLSSSISYIKFFALLLSCLESSTHLLPLFACSGILTALLSRFIHPSIPRSPAILLFLHVLGPTPSYLAFTVFRILNKPCQMSFCTAVQPVLQNLFIRFHFLACCPTKPTINGFLIQDSSTLAHLPVIMIEKKLT